MTSPESETLSRAGLFSIFAFLRQRPLHWLGHVRQMDHSRIPKPLLYGELSSGSRTRRRPKLRFKDVIQNDMKHIGLHTNTWEEASSERLKWRARLSHHLRKGEEKLRLTRDARRQKRKVAPDQLQTSVFTCINCGRRCLSRIGLHRHRQRYRLQRTQNP